MQKRVPQLTISVAAYNVADTIDQCLASCIAIDSLDMLEIIVVDDGATDNTAEIVQKYINRHPAVIRFVHKENGGYGSTVNTSISMAQGRYFKLLDGDDWVDSDALDRLLQTLAKQDADIVISPFVKRFGDNSAVVDQASSSVIGYQPFDGDIILDTLSMHSICYKTDLVRESGMILPKHRLYTDALYAVVPLQLVKTAYISHEPVYQYRLGIDGQSVSRESLEAHYADMYLIVLDLFELYETLEDKYSLPGRISLNWLVGDATWVAAIIFSMQPTAKLRQELYGLIDLLALDEVVFDRCVTSGKVFRIVTQIPRKMYAPASYCYGIVKRLKP